MATLLIHLPDLEPGQEERVESVIRGMPGVFGVVVSSDEACAEVDFADDEASLDRILERLREQGIQARLAG